MLELRSTKKNLLLPLALVLFSNLASLPKASSQSAEANLLEISQLKRASEFYGQLSNQRIRTAAQRRLSESRSSASPNESRTKQGLEFAGHQGQALLLMLMLAGADVVKQEFAQSNLRQSEMDLDTIMTMSGKAADQILLGGETWAGLLGGAVAGAASSRPLQVINFLMKDANARPTFRLLLQAGIASLVTFAGWELMSMLMKQAVDMIEDPQDYDRAKRLGATFIDFVASIGANENAEHRRILSLVFGNIYDILVHKPELRNLTLYNAWRHKIATGHFVILVSSMAAGTTIGTALFPGAGTVAGFCFGVAGGLLTLITPASITNSITSGFIQVRILNARQNSHVNFLNLRTFVRNAQNRKIPLRENRHIDNDIRRELLLGLGRSRAARQYESTARFEDIYKIMASAIVSEGQTKVASDHGNHSAAHQLRSEREVLLIALRDRFQKLLEPYRRDREYLSEIQSLANPFEPIVERERARLLQVENLLRVLGEALLSQETDEETKNSFRILITKIYLEGFRETELLSE